MCLNIKRYNEFHSKGITVESDFAENYVFYLLKDNSKYKLQFHKSDENRIIDSGLLNYKLIKGFEAIYSIEDKTIECQLSLTFSEYEWLSNYLKDYTPIYDNDTGEQVCFPPKSIDIKNNFNINLSIGNYSEVFNVYINCKGQSYNCRERKYSLKISNIKIIDHKDALKKLSDIGLTTLFEISNNLDINMVLMQDQPFIDKFSFLRYIEPNSIKEQSTLPTLNKKYNVRSIGFYLNANTCNDLPFYKYLQYYHCLEYYFTYKINSKTPNALNRLNYVIKNNCNINEIKTFINSDIILKDYFLNNKTCKAIHTRLIINKSNKITSFQISKRLYGIRNLIVHSNSKGPFLSRSLDSVEMLRNDIALLQFIVEKVLTKSGI